MIQTICARMTDVLPRVVAYRSTDPDPEKPFGGKWGKTGLAR